MAQVTAMTLVERCRLTEEETAAFQKAPTPTVAVLYTREAQLEKALWGVVEWLRQLPFHVDRDRGERIAIALLEAAGLGRPE